jgi:hypothetical protein
MRGDSSMYRSVCMCVYVYGTDTYMYAHISQIQGCRHRDLTCIPDTLYIYIYIYTTHTHTYIYMPSYLANNKVDLIVTRLAFLTHYIIHLLFEIDAIVRVDLCMYVCMYVCAYVCACVLLTKYITHLLFEIHSIVWVDLCMYVCMCEYVCVHMCMYVYMYMCVYIYIYACS